MRGVINNSTWLNVILYPHGITQIQIFIPLSSHTGVCFFINNSGDRSVVFINGNVVTINPLIWTFARIFCKAKVIQPNKFESFRILINNCCQQTCGTVASPRPIRFSLIANLILILHSRPSNCIDFFPISHQVRKTFPVLFLESCPAIGRCILGQIRFRFAYNLAMKSS